MLTSDKYTNTEMAVIGACLSDNTAFGKVAMMLSSEHFKVPEYQEAWEIMNELYDKGKGIDLLTVSMKSSNVHALVDATNIVASTAHMLHHAAFLINRRANEIKVKGLTKANECEDSLEAIDIMAETMDAVRYEVSKIRSEDLYVWDPTDEPDPDAFKFGFQFNDLTEKYLMSRSDLCIVTGDRGSMKSTFVYTLVTGAINMKPLLGFFHRREPGQKVVYFDTEQSTDRIKRNFGRIKRHMDSTEDFILHGTTDMDTHERMRHVINYILFADHEIYMVVIDGLVDLVEDENSNTESRRLIHQLRRALNKKKCMCVVVMHPRRGEKYSTGHLGSYAEKKADAAFFVDFYRKHNASKLTCTKSREGYVPEMWIEWFEGLARVTKDPTKDESTYNLNQ